MPSWTPKTPYMAQLYPFDGGTPDELFFPTSDQLEQEVEKHKASARYRRITSVYRPSENRNEWQGIDDWMHGA